MTRDDRVTNHDALSEFASEPVPPPATSELDALIEAASAGALAAFPSEADEPPAAVRTTANTRWRWSVGVSMQPNVVRWVAAPLTAFVIGATLVAWGLRTIEPAAPSLARATPPAEMTEATSAPVDGPPAPTSLAATVTSTITATVPEPVLAPVQAPPAQPPVIESTIGVVPPAAVAPPSVGAATATLRPPAALPAAPPADRAAAPPPVREAAPAPLRATESAPVRAAAPAPLPPAARPTLPRSAPAPLPPPAPAATFDARSVLPSAIAEPPPIAPPATTVDIAAADVPRAVVAPTSPALPVIEDQAAVRVTLDHYADAYAGMDVRATAAVWPSVDRRALTRAFATLKSQGLTFDSCNINVNDMSATAYCRGTVQFVRKIGSPTPLTAAQEWRFVMRKLGGTWTIDEVTATRGAMASAQVRTGS